MYKIRSESERRRNFLGRFTIANSSFTPQTSPKIRYCRFDLEEKLKKKFVEHDLKSKVI